MSFASNPHGPLILISGRPHSGKSYLVAELLQQLRPLGWRIAGILAEGHWQNDRRSGFTLVDLSDGRRTPLAARIVGDDSQNPPYVFHASGIAAGYRALATERCARADLLVVDEVGCLELQGGGWADRLAPLLARPEAVHIWVVQSAWLPAVCRTWRLSPLRIITAIQDGALDQLREILQSIGTKRL